MGTDGGGKTVSSVSSELDYNGDRYIKLTNGTLLPENEEIYMISTPGEYLQKLGRVDWEGHDKCESNKRVVLTCLSGNKYCGYKDILPNIEV